MGGERKRGRPDAGGRRNSRIAAICAAVGIVMCAVVLTAAGISEAAERQEGSMEAAERQVESPETEEKTEGSPETAAWPGESGADDVGTWQVREIRCSDLEGETPIPLETGAEIGEGMIDFFREEARFLVEAELTWEAGDDGAEESGTGPEAGDDGAEESGAGREPGDTGEAEAGTETDVDPREVWQLPDGDAALEWLADRLRAERGGAETDLSAWIAFTEAEMQSEGRSAEYRCRLELSVRGDGRHRLMFAEEEKEAVLLREFGIDGTPPDLEAAVEDPAGSGIYHADVPLRIQAEDAAEGAGLARIAWRVTTDPEGETAAQEGVQEIAGPGDLLRAQEELRIVVDSARSNSSAVRVEILAEDRMGNQSRRELPLDIDVTPPRVELSFSDPPEKLSRYAGVARSVMITIRERSEHFREEEMREGIRISVTDASGHEITDPEGVIWGEWETLEGESPDDAAHRITLTFRGEGTYDWSVTCRDLAGNVSEPAEVTAGGEEISGTAEGLWQFTLDRTPPEGVLRAVSSEGESASWTHFPNRDSEGLWSAGEIRLRLETSDAISPVTSAAYLVTDTWKIRSRKSLERERGWRDCGDLSSDFLTLDEDRQMLVWIRLVDAAGNESYLGTGGLLVDRTSPEIAADLPRITLSLPEPGVFLYSGDVAVSVEAEDPPVRGTASGLQAVRWQLGQGEDLLESGTLWEAGSRPGVLSDPGGYRGTLTVDGSRYEGDGMWVRVQAADRTGNLAWAEVRFGLDHTPPEIRIRFDENAPKTPGFYRRGRTAEVTIRDEHLQMSGIRIHAGSGEGAAAGIGRWVWDGPSQVSARVRFREEGEYDFSVTCRDAAGNAAGAPSYADGTRDPEHFVIDRTAPELLLESAESAVNGRYYAGERRIRIAVREKYFDPALVRIEQTSEYLGDPITPPEVQWTSAGDLHVAELRYVRDGDYSLRLSAEDPAGNSDTGADTSRAEPLDAFTVDTLPAEISVDGISEGGILGFGEEGIDPEASLRIRFSDLHFAGYTAELLRSRVLPGEGDDLRIETDTDVTDTFLHPVPGGESPELILRIPLRSESGESNDGLYCVRLAARDLAGNRRGPLEVHFSVNRFGSVFVLDSYTRELTGESCIPRVTKPLILREYNPDPVEEASVVMTRDGGRETAAVRREEEAGGERSGPWYSYIYEILPENFSEDGRYHLRLTSRDLAGHRTDSEEKSGEIAFIVDQTPPEIRSLTGLEREEPGVNSLDVAYEIFDTFGVDSCRVWVDDSPVLEQAEIRAIYSGGTFSVSGEGCHHIRMRIADRAGNVLDTDARDEDGNYIYRPAFPFVRDVSLRAGGILPQPKIRAEEEEEHSAQPGEPWERWPAAAVAVGILLTGTVFLVRIRKKRQKVLDRTE